MLSDVVHTGDESLWDSLGDVWTCEITLASAYVLCHLSAMWLQFQIRERSLSWKWVLIWYIAVEHQRLSLIRVYLCQLLD